MRFARPPSRRNKAADETRTEGGAVRLARNHGCYFESEWGRGGPIRLPVALGVS